jgi:hypothetical protein
MHLSSFQSGIAVAVAALLLGLGLLARAETLGARAGGIVLVLVGLLTLQREWRLHGRR